ncbi:MAG: HD domain-containing protein [Chloroflexi bacterium]|nr:HD domain-containing protein [Chloroflexota bacterium]
MTAETTRTDPANAPDGVVAALLQTMRVWEPSNLHHCERTADYALAIARELGVDDAAAQEVQVGALLHDIGKVGVDLAVLRKPATLDSDEQENVRRHPEMGASILERVLPPGVVACAASHHEQPDGRGYPHGLREAEIPLGALICRVADVFDSLTSDQSYRPAMRVEEALLELEGGAGTLYSARCVAVLESLVGRGWRRPAA